MKQSTRTYFRSLKTGRFVSQSFRGEKTRESYVVQTEPAGRVVRGYLKTPQTRRIITEPTWFTSQPERYQGRIDVLLTNVMTQVRFAGMTEFGITIKAKDARGHPLKFKTQFYADTKGDVDKYFIARILDMLERQGYRTQYTLEKVNWKTSRTTRSDKAKGLRAHRSQKFSARLKVIHDVSVIIHARRGRRKK